jgi:cyclopropane-fatty-acyl-phospholipid synthase
MIYDALLGSAIRLTEHGFMPDFAIREGIRRLCRQRLQTEASRHDIAAFARRMRAFPQLAPVPEKANEQHYEVPSSFFGYVLGPHRKYSCCFFPDATTTLAQAEAFALAETCRRAQLDDGQDILELGCGWGSLSLWMAAQYPNSRITAVSNSASQRHYIEAQAAARGLANLRVITSDMNRFQPPGQYDRIVSVEMFEHMRNYAELLRRIESWMKPGARLFVHIFCHRQFAYEYETEGEHNWMGRYFFTGGIMPSFDIFSHFEDHLRVEERWQWDGTHYQRTAGAWLANLDASAAAVLPILERTYGDGESTRWYHRWRVFFLSCAELFGFHQGREWIVGHYRFTRR